jgi:hypothetical protein
VHSGLFLQVSKPLAGEIQTHLPAWFSIASTSQGFWSRRTWLYKRISQTRRGWKKSCILASGYVSAEAESRVANGELCGALQKSYVEEEVLALVKQAIRSQ